MHGFIQKIQEIKGPLVVEIPGCISDYMGLDKEDSVVVFLNGKGEMVVKKAPPTPVP